MVFQGEKYIALCHWLDFVAEGKVGRDDFEFVVDIFYSFIAVDIVVVRYVVGQKFPVCLRSEHVSVYYLVGEYQDVMGGVHLF